MHQALARPLPHRRCPSCSSLPIAGCLVSDGLSLFCLEYRKTIYRRSTNVYRDRRSGHPTDHHIGDHRTLVGFLIRNLTVGEGCFVSASLDTPGNPGCTLPPLSPRRTEPTDRHTLSHRSHIRCVQEVLNSRSAELSRMGGHHSRTAVEEGRIHRLDILIAEEAGNYSGRTQRLAAAYAVARNLEGWDSRCVDHSWHVEEIWVPELHGIADRCIRWQAAGNMIARILLAEAHDSPRWGRGSLVLTC